MNLTVLGQRIKDLREKRGLKQRDIANALQISAQAVSKWERGENAPDIAILLDLSKLLGVSCDALLGRGETEDTFEATVFVSDMKGFAMRSMSMPPRDVALWANGIFHLVTESVVRHDGIPVKYVGDGFLAFFSGPNHAKRALLAAMDARTHVPTPDLGITLHSGDIFLGNIGHAEYARPDIIGDTVNTAFLVMNWVSANAKSRLGITETVAERVQDGYKLSKPTAVHLKLMGRKIWVFEVK